MENEKLLFLRKFLQQGIKIAGLVPASASLAIEMCRYINPHQPQIILELGCGTGAVTEIALKKMHPNSTLIAVEADPELAAFAQNRCKQARVLNCNAEEMVSKIHSMNINAVDLIITSLPTTNLPISVSMKVYEACQKLMKHPDVIISQQTLIPWVYYRKYKKIFREVDFHLILRSLPPGGVYHCKGLRKDFAKYFW